jgi:hypothetical protein
MVGNLQKEMDGAAPVTGGLTIPALEKSKTGDER